MEDNNMEDFDTLRREATKLERHLEDRVSRYQQVRGFYVEADLKNVYHSSSQYYTIPLCYAYTNVTHTSLVLISFYAYIYTI